MNTVTLVVSLIVQFLVLVIGTYYFSVSIIGCLFVKEDKREPKINKINKFALIAAAHNEESVIDNLVDSLKAMDYPKDAFEVFVIADNCTDATAKIAREHGAVVYERFDEENRGKGFALEFAFEKIFASEEQFDGICVFDADNVVDSKFLYYMNRQFNKGSKAVQGYIDTKNPYDSWITTSYAISFWTINRLYQYARYNLGMCCQLCGTGFALSTDIIKKIGWGATCLAEDMEFTMQLVLNGISVGYAKEAIVYDEKPLTLSQSVKQRTRWMQGHADVASRFIPRLFKKAVKENDVLAFDCIIYLLQPTLLIMLLIITTVSFIKLFYPPLGMWFLTNLAIPPYLWNLVMLGQFLLTPLVLWAEGKLTKKMIIYYVPYLVYTYTWLPIAVVGVIRKNNKDWFHTEHTRKISADDIKH